MSDQANALADRFQRANQATIDAIEHASEDQLRASCEGEGCTVASLGYHVGSVHALATGWALDIANGNELPPVTMDMVNASNAEQFAAHANESREEVLNVLRENGQAATQAVRDLSDEALARSAYFKLLDRDMTTADMIEFILIGDTEGHLPSIQAAIANA